MGKMIKGKYTYKGKKEKSEKQIKKEQKKLQEKMLRKQDKELKMKCDCNHIDKKDNRIRWKESEDGSTRTCKICGGKVIANPDLLTNKTAESAVLQIYSIFSLVRNRLGVDEETDRQITKMLQMVMRSPELLTLVKESRSSNKDKKKDKKKKKKNKKNKNNYRYSY